LLVALGRLQREVQDVVMRTRMVPAKNIAPRLQRAVRQTCRLTSKQANLILKGSDTLIDSDVINNLIDPLMHMLRNAVDHGIEPREDRIRKGKDPVGCIELEFAREGALVVVRCRDDGRGLDAEAIRATAERRGMIAPGLPLGREEFQRLILQPGFSTRRETTQTSGRGIGLDVVNNRLAAIKGSMRIETEPDRGTLFELRMPASLLTAHGLLVRVRRQTMAISSHGIERIMHPGDGRLIENGGALQYQVDEELLDTTLLDDLLALPKDRRAGNREERPALLVRDGDLKHVILVEQVYDTRDLVIKPLGAYLRSVRGIIGATILGDGSVVAVLDLPELIRMPRLKVLEEADRTDTRMIPPSLPLALVVDDSISARRALAQVLQDAGYQVRMAKDGLEAAGIIEKRRPDIMLVDLEMPRMNGVELTSHVRANPHTRDLPIIMVTSRSTEKHRNLAEAAGADVYLTKPFSEDQLLKHVHDLLERFARTVTSEDTEPGTQDLGLRT
jgi:chemosensory pili system protein ChpA (sensor histidine kinase/response regulator)